MATPESSAPRPRKPLRRVLSRALSDLTDMLGRPIEGIVGVERLDDHSWRIQVEVLESRRIPDTTDILGLYEVDLDGDGGLTAYRRLSRYVRGRAEE